MRHVCAWFLRRLERVLDILELELQMVVSCLVGAENPRQVLLTSEPPFQPQELALSPVAINILACSLFWVLFLETVGQRLNTVMWMVCTPVWNSLAGVLCLWVWGPARRRGLTDLQCPGSYGYGNNSNMLDSGVSRISTGSYNVSYKTIWSF